MPLTLAQLLAPTAESELAYAGESLTITWRPGGMTPATQARILQVQGEPLEAQLPVLVAILVEVVASWDLLDAEGTPLPVTIEQLERLPSGFLWDVFNFLRGESLPKARTGAHSGATSAPAGSSAKRRSGTGSSSPRKR